MNSKKLTLFSKSDLIAYTKYRNGEIKLGERIHLLETESWTEELKDAEPKYAVLGIPEDVGIKANWGRTGASTAWSSFLNSFF
jgi:formiminoglutamase